MDVAKIVPRVAHGEHRVGLGQVPKGDVVLLQDNSRACEAVVSEDEVLERDRLRLIEAAPVQNVKHVGAVLKIRFDSFLLRISKLTSLNIKLDLVTFGPFRKLISKT